MASISSLDTVTPHVPIPKPPSAKEDRAWDGVQSHHTKGKGREEEEDYHDPGSVELSELDPGAYPPMTGNEAETRRVEENLRRWEVAERQRRKTARESPLGVAASPSFVGDVSRRASLLWSGKKSTYSHNHSDSGSHTPLPQSQETADDVPLRSVNASPTPSPTASESGENNPENPFANPHSPFADPNEHRALMTASPEPSSLAPSTDQPTSITSGLLSPPSIFSRPPPPGPLGLPPPRTPPPVIDTPPPHTSSPVPTRPLINAEENHKETRWWHDWLCGCGEGPDRGGNNQAGRTNPFE